jgi:hypothetical protein
MVKNSFGVTHKPVLEATTFEVVLEFASHVFRQAAPFGRHLGEERRVVLREDLIEKGLFGAVTLGSQRRVTGAGAGPREST